MFLLSFDSFHLRIVTAEISGIISLRLVMEDSNAIGYCSSFKIEVSSTDGLIEVEGHFLTAGVICMQIWR